MTVVYGANGYQQGDPRLYQIGDRCELNIEGGIVEMTETIHNVIYLSLNGGNEEDNGSDATAHKGWWGNFGEPEENQYRSRTNSLLRGRPITSGTATELYEAALEDLNRDLVSTRIARSVSIDRMEVRNKGVTLSGVVVLLDGTPVPFEHSTPAGA